MRAAKLFLAENTASIMIEIKPCVFTRIGDEHHPLPRPPRQSYPCKLSSTSEKESHIQSQVPDQVRWAQAPVPASFTHLSPNHSPSETSHAARLRSRSAFCSAALVSKRSSGGLSRALQDAARHGPLRRTIKLERSKTVAADWCVKTRKVFTTYGVLLLIISVMMVKDEAPKT